MLNDWIKPSLEDNGQEIDLHKAKSDGDDAASSLNHDIDSEAEAKKEGTVGAELEPASTGVDDTTTKKPDDHLEVKASNEDGDKEAGDQGDQPKVEGELDAGGDEVETGEETTVKDGEENGDVDNDAEPEVKEAEAAMESFKVMHTAIEAFRETLEVTHDPRVVGAIKTAVESFDEDFSCDTVIPSVEHFGDADKRERAVGIAREGLEKASEKLKTSMENIDKFLKVKGVVK